MNRSRNSNQNNDYVEAPKEFSETVVQVNRISKKTKGGNTIRFSALVVIGNRNGRVGAGISKARDVRAAIQKAINYAKKHMIDVPLRGTTIPYEVQTKYGAARVMLKPAPAGSGIIAGGTVRVVLELSGVKDAVGKTLGTNNKVTNVYATLQALSMLEKLSVRRRKPSVKKQDLVEVA